MSWNSSTIRWLKRRAVGGADLGSAPAAARRGSADPRSRSRRGAPWRPRSGRRRAPAGSQGGGRRRLPRRPRRCVRSPPRSLRGRPRAPSPCCRCAAPSARRARAAVARPAAPALRSSRLCVRVVRLQLLERLGGGSRRARARSPPGRARRLGQPRLGDAAAAQLRVGAGDDRPQPVDLERGDGLLARLLARRPGTPPALPRRPRRAARSVSGASSTRKRGSIPAATGWPASSRLQKPWIVVTQAPPMPPSSCSARSEPSSARARQLGADPLAQLGCGLVGEGEGEDRVGRDALLADQAAVAVDHHPGLAGAGAGLDQHVAPGGLDRRRLLGGRQCARSSAPPPRRPPRDSAPGRGGRSARSRRRPGRRRGPADPVAGRGRGGSRRSASGRRSRRPVAAPPPAAPRAPRRRPCRWGRGRRRRASPAASSRTTPRGRRTEVPRSGW